MLQDSQESDTAKEARRLTASSSICRRTPGSLSTWNGVVKWLPLVSKSYDIGASHRSSLEPAKDFASHKGIYYWGGTNGRHGRQHRQNSLNNKPSFSTVSQFVKTHVCGADKSNCSPTAAYRSSSSHMQAMSLLCNLQCCRTAT